ncbi:MAG: phage virion morphogenesis protein [Fibrobacter sp.]|nr:phage virion morphogenesis protein [Fibrobacter sp.]
MASFINATIDDHKFDALIEVMNDHAVHLKPVLAAIGNLAVKSVKQNFRVGGRPTRWAKTDKPKGNTMIGTGALMRQIHYKVDNDESGVTIMTGKQKYAAILHFGGKTPAHEIWYKNKRALSFTWKGVPVIYGKVNHPGSLFKPRPYMLLQDEDVKIIENMMIQHIVKNT